MTWLILTSESPITHKHPSQKYVSFVQLKRSIMHPGWCTVTICLSLQNHKECFQKHFQEPQRVKDLLACRNAHASTISAFLHLKLLKCLTLTVWCFVGSTPYNASLARSLYPLFPSLFPSATLHSTKLNRTFSLVAVNLQSHHWRVKLNQPKDISWPHKQLLCITGVLLSSRLICYHNWAQQYSVFSAYATKPNNKTHC